MGLGVVAPAPGTFGSLVGLICAVFLRNKIPMGISYLLVGIIFLLGWYASGYCEGRVFFREDPKEIIVDEFVGMMVVSLSIPFFASMQVLGFVCFRFFDIYKPYPIGLVEQVTMGGMGVMLDDILAGIFSIFSVYITLQFF